MLILTVVEVSNSGRTNNVQPEFNKTLSQDDFFKIFLAELKNQSPLSPMNDQQFLSQMVQFASLQQVQSLEERVKELSEEIGRMAERQAGRYEELVLTQAVTFIGKEVTAVDPETGSVFKGTVTGLKVREGQINLVLNGLQVPLRNISGVQETGNDTSTEGGAGL